MNPQTSQGGALLGANQDQIRRVAFSSIVFLVKVALGGHDVIDQHRHVIALKICETNSLAVWFGASDEVGIGCYFPEIRADGGAFAVAAKIEGEDREAFVLKLFGEFFPALMVAAVAVEHQNGRRFRFCRRIKCAAQFHAVD